MNISSSNMDGDCNDRTESSQLSVYSKERREKTWKIVEWVESGKEGNGHETGGRVKGKEKGRKKGVNMAGDYVRLIKTFHKPHYGRQGRLSSKVKT